MPPTPGQDAAQGERERLANFIHEIFLEGPNDPRYLECADYLLSEWWAPQFDDLCEDIENAMGKAYDNPLEYRRLIRAALRKHRLI